MNMFRYDITNPLRDYLIMRRVKSETAWREPGLYLRAVTFLGPDPPVIGWKRLPARPRFFPRLDVTGQAARCMEHVRR